MIPLFLGFYYALRHNDRMILLTFVNQETAKGEAFYPDLPAAVPVLSLLLRLSLLR
jgi:hypothetical protein